MTNYLIAFEDGSPIRELERMRIAIKNNLAVLLKKRKNPSAEPGYFP
jgi:hypothetical protein